MSPAKMQVIGLCRFSYPALGGFQVEHDSIEERIAFLYSDKRMQERFATFASLTLPPLRAQTDPDFTLAIVVGDQMPAPLMNRLLDLVEDMPQAIVIPRPPGRHRDVMREVINQIREESALPSLQFRMDDDDAVSVNFVQRLREAATDLQSFIGKHRYVGLDFNTGHIARIGPEGIYAKPCMQSLWTPALGMAVSPSASRGVLNFSHAKLNRIMPVITLPGENMFIRGHNDFNDSRQKEGIKPMRLSRLDAEGEAQFRQVYNVDADVIRALYNAPPKDNIMRVIGICRFSYPALGGFKRMHETTAEREAYLYENRRMALRFAHFEALTLPCLRAQTDQDFTFLIVIGENMPEPWLSRLYNLCAPIPQIKIVVLPPMRHRSAMQMAMQAELGEGQPESLQFRLDDDDAMGVDFIAETRLIVRRSRRLRRQSPRTAIDFSTGYAATLSKDGIIAQSTFSPFMTSGLAVYFAQGNTKTIMNYGHHKLHHVMPSIIYPKPPMYIRAKHADNDSAFKPRGLKPLSPGQADMFRVRFNVDEDQVRRVFAAADAPHDTA